MKWVKNPLQKISKFYGLLRTLGVRLKSRIMVVITIFVLWFLLIYEWPQFEKRGYFIDTEENRGWVNTSLEVHTSSHLFGVELLTPYFEGLLCADCWADRNDVAKSPDMVMGLKEITGRVVAYDTLGVSNNKTFISNFLSIINILGVWLDGISEICCQIGIDYERLLNSNLRLAISITCELFWNRLDHRAVLQTVGFTRNRCIWGSIKFEGPEMWSFPFKGGGDDTNSISALNHNIRVTFFITGHMEFIPFNTLFSYNLLYRCLLILKPRRHHNPMLTWKDNPLAWTFRWSCSSVVRVNRGTCLESTIEITNVTYSEPKTSYTYKHTWKVAQEFPKVGIGVGLAWLKYVTLNTQQHSFQDLLKTATQFLMYCDATGT